MRVWPSAASITRLEQTFDWVLWIEEAERKLIWSRAARVPWKQISGELGVDRTTAWRKHKLALDQDRVAPECLNESNVLQHFCVRHMQQFRAIRRA